MSYTFAIGDIHGCHAELERLLQRIQWARPVGGTVVFLGDYVDRGQNSKAVIETIRNGPTKPGWKWIALKGNHEDMMVDAHRAGGDVMLWVGNGGGDTLASFGNRQIPDDVLEWADALPLYHADKHRIFVHAGLDETVPLDCQTEHGLLWSRKPPHYSGEYGGFHVCHGHTPYPTNPVTISNRTNVDSGCVFWGKLSCAVFDDDVAGGPIEFLTVESIPA